MAVTKRTRFEVLRRDDHTCQYCGAKAPDVTLHIDHVMPVSLGGDDKPGNLVTACKDCNSGKASITPDSPLVQGLGEKAAAYALGMVDKMTRFRARFEALDDYVAEFLDLWGKWGSWPNHDPIELPGDFRRSLLRWMDMGVPIGALAVCIDTAMSAKYLRGDHAEFSYMAGVLTRMLDDHEIDLSLDNLTVSVYTQGEMQEMYAQSYEAGRKRGAKERCSNCGTNKDDQT